MSSFQIIDSFIITDGGQFEGLICSSRSETDVVMGDFCWLDLSIVDKHDQHSVQYLFNSVLT